MKMATYSPQNSQCSDDGVDLEFWLMFDVCVLVVHNIFNKMFQQRNVLSKLSLPLSNLCVLEVDYTLNKMENC